MTCSYFSFFYLFIFFWKGCIPDKEENKLIQPELEGVRKALLGIMALCLCVVQKWLCWAAGLAPGSLSSQLHLLCGTHCSGCRGYYARFFVCFVPLRKYFWWSLGKSKWPGARLKAVCAAGLQAAAWQWEECLGNPLAGSSGNHHGEQHRNTSEIQILSFMWKLGLRFVCLLEWRSTKTCTIFCTLYAL